jgi:hypothetical protein
LSSPIFLAICPSVDLTGAMAATSNDPLMRLWDRADLPKRTVVGIALYTGCSHAGEAMESMKSIRQCHIVLYKRLGETQWTIRHGWIPTEDGESLRQYFSTLPTCEEFYVVPSEPRNNTLQMFGEIRTEFENPKDDCVSTPKQLEDRKTVTAQLLRRNKARVKQEDQGETERREQLRQIGTTLPSPCDPAGGAQLP